MIKTENITIDGRTLQRTYSDAGFFITRNGCRYIEAVDPVDSGRTYTETTEPIPDAGEDGEPVTPEDEATVEDYKTALVELGVIK